MSYEGLDFDISESVLYRSDKLKQEKCENRIQTILYWGVFCMCGFLTGVLAFGVNVGVELLSDFKFEQTQRFLEKNNIKMAFAVFGCFSVGCVFIATLLVNCLEPVAGGSGIPELKGYLNGTNVHRLLRLKTLFVKCVGVLFSVSGGLCIGKEGPLVHSGAAIAANISHLPTCAIKKSRKRLKVDDDNDDSVLDNDASQLRCGPGKNRHSKWRRFRFDHFKRDFVSGGCAAGVAAAFGAPIGGVLFSLEEASSFWSLPLTWRVFFAAMISTFSLQICNAIRGGIRINSDGLITFGKFPDVTFNTWELPIFAIMAVCGGLIGGLFNALNTKLCHLRRDYLSARAINKNVRKWSKVLRTLEALAVVMLTTCLQFWVPALFPCRDIAGGIKTNHSQQLESDETFVAYTCEEGQYNSMASLIFSGNEATILALFHNNLVEFSWTSLVTYFLLIFILAVVTYGLAVPSGLFVPCILVGSSFGRLVGLVLHALKIPIAHTGTYALIGATSVLGGVTRMTISLTVILLETTNDIQFLLPIMMVLMVSKWVGDLMNISLYDLHVEIKCIPFVEANPPLSMKNLSTKDVMKSPVVGIPRFTTLREISELLEHNHHNGFPVFGSHVDTQAYDKGGEGQTHHAERESELVARKTLSGLILRNQLVTVLRHMLRRDRAGDSDLGIGDLSVLDFVVTLSSKMVKDQQIPPLIGYDDIADKVFDLGPFINPAPYSVQTNWPLSRVYRLYRTMGIRHLPVVNQLNEVVGILTRKELMTDFTVDLS